MQNILVYQTPWSRKDFSLPGCCGVSPNWYCKAWKRLCREFSRQVPAKGFGKGKVLARVWGEGSGKVCGKSGADSGVIVAKVSNKVPGKRSNKVSGEVAGFGRFWIRPPWIGQPPLQIEHLLVVGAQLWQKPQGVSQRGRC